MRFKIKLKNFHKAGYFRPSETLKNKKIIYPPYILLKIIKKVLFLIINPYICSIIFEKNKNEQQTPKKRFSIFKFTELRNQHAAMHKLWHRKLIIK